MSSLADAELAITRGAEVICFTHNLLVPDDFLDLAPKLAAEGVGVLARSPLMHGMLAGRWTKDTKFPETDHRSRRWAEPAFATRLAQVEKLRFLVRPEEKDGIPDLATAALRYALVTPLVSAAVVGARTPEQIQHAVGALPTTPETPLFAQADLERLAEMEL